MRQFTTGEELSANVDRCWRCIWHLENYVSVMFATKIFFFIFDCRLEEEAERADRVAEIAEAEARRCRFRSFDINLSALKVLLED